MYAWLCLVGVVLIPLPLLRPLPSLFSDKNEPRVEGSSSCASLSHTHKRKKRNICDRHNWLGIERRTPELFSRVGWLHGLKSRAASKQDLKSNAFLADFMGLKHTHAHVLFALSLPSLSVSLCCCIITHRRTRTEDRTVATTNKNQHFGPTRLGYVFYVTTDFPKSKRGTNFFLHS